jgi:hypothetical protein
LFLCRNLVEVMGGEIGLDDSYDSGVPGHPGSRFVVSLKRKPIEFLILILLVHMFTKALSSIQGVA